MIYTPQTKPLLGVPINWAHPLSKGLVGFWLMNEGSGGKIYDLSGNNNVGTLTNMDGSTGGWSPGRSGQALKFDGVDDYVSAGTAASLRPSLPVSVSAWVYIKSLPSNNMGVFQSGKPIVGTGYHSGYHSSIMSTGVMQTSYGDNTSGTVTGRRTKAGTTGLSANRWYYLTYVIQGATNMQLYINCVDDGGTYTGSGGTMVYGSGSAEIGNLDNIDGATPTRLLLPFNGLIDDPRIYNRALSAQEIWQLYATPYAMFERRPYWMNYVAPAGGFTSKIMVDGTWKTSSSALVMVDGSWKSVSSGKIMVDGTWKALG